MNGLCNVEVGKYVLCRDRPGGYGAVCQLMVGLNHKRWQLDLCKRAQNATFHAEMVEICSFS